MDSFLQTLWANFYSIALIKEKKISFDKELTVNEDISFNFSYTYFVKKYVFINECLYNYREIPNSLSRTDLQAEWRVEMRFQSLKRRILFLNDCNIKNKQYVINKHISNMVSGSTLFSPFCRRLYQLKEYADLKHVRSNGQRRVIFCLQHNLLWFYKFYMTIKHELFILTWVYHKKQFEQPCKNVLPGERRGEELAFNPRIPFRNTFALWRLWTLQANYEPENLAPKYIALFEKMLK